MRFLAVMALCASLLLTFSGRAHAEGNVLSDEIRAGVWDGAHVATSLDVASETHRMTITANKRGWDVLIKSPDDVWTYSRYGIVLHRLQVEGYLNHVENFDRQFGRISKKLNKNDETLFINVLARNLMPASDDPDDFENVLLTMEKIINAKKTRDQKLLDGWVDVFNKNKPLD